MIIRYITYEEVAALMRSCAKPPTIHPFVEEMKHAAAVRGMRLVSASLHNPGAFMDGHKLVGEVEPLPLSPGWDSEGRECWEWPR